jgi:Protein of unknown function (DUF1579)
MKTNRSVLRSLLPIKFPVSFHSFVFSYFRVFVVGIGIGLALTSTRGLGAGDKKDKVPSPPPPTGPEHKLLKNLAGTFDAAVTIFGDDGKKDQSKGVMKRQMILGGRILHEEYEGTFGGQAFKGMGMIGYDPHKKMYTSVWADNMTNAIVTSEGTYDDKATTFHYAGNDVDAYTGKTLKSRDTLKIVSPDEQLLVMYRQPAGGKEFKMLEIRYVRKK